MAFSSLLPSDKTNHYFYQAGTYFVQSTCLPDPRRVGSLVIIIIIITVVVVVVVVVVVIIIIIIIGGGG